MKIVFSGSRTWDSPKEVYALFDVLDERLVSVIHGGAVGADTIIHNVAEHYGYIPKVIEPDYDRYSRKQAPIIRNRRMAELGQIVFAFRSHGKSRGTDNLIANAVLLGIPAFVCVNDSPYYNRLAHEVGYRNYHALSGGPQPEQRHLDAIQIPERIKNPRIMNPHEHVLEPGEDE